MNDAKADLLLRGGHVIDGAGNPAMRGDVAVTGDRIISVGPGRGGRARRVVDVDGLVVAPGFVDMHAHSDLQLLAEPAHEAKLAQGVTLEVLGQDGLSYAPVTDQVLEQLRVQLRGWNDDPSGFDWSWRSVGGYLDRLDQGIATNAAYLVPHGTVRMCVVGNDDRLPTSEELERMKALVAQGMREGAVGLSAGLTYTPGMYAADDELVALCRVVAQHGGYYCPHHRNYGAHALEAYRDSIEIARRAGVPLHLAHAHLGFPINRGRAGELLGMIDAAWDEGVEVTFDTYPYLAGATYLHALLPPWLLEGGTTAALARLRDPDLRERIRVEMEDTGHAGHHDLPVDWSVVVLTGVRHPAYRRHVGATIEGAARETECRPVDLFCDLVADDEFGASCLVHIGNEENVRAIMQHRAHTGGSDGILVGEQPHPRGWGTFPRYLGRYVRDLGLLSLEECVRHLTSLPAQRLGFGDRGLVRPGMAADLVVFDPATVRDRATYEEPRAAPDGIPYVVVNGELVIDGGRHTGVLAGRALRHRGARYADG